MKITQLNQTLPNDFNGLTKYIVTDGSGNLVYLYRKPESPAPQVGETLEGAIKQDARGQLKFTAEKPAFTPKAGGAAPREFKADPVKQESIEWQNALTNAREAVKDFHTLSGEKPKDLATYKLDIVNAVITFTQTIEKKPDKPIVTAPATDNLPTDEEATEEVNWDEVDV